MSGRKSLKIRHPTASRFERFRRPDENQTDALARLLDRADVPEVLQCAECDTNVQAHARDDEGRILCFDCAGVDRADALLGDDA